MEIREEEIFKTIINGNEEVRSENEKLKRENQKLEKESSHYANIAGVLIILFLLFLFFGMPWIAVITTRGWI